MVADKSAALLGTWTCKRWHPNKNDVGEDYTAINMKAQADKGEVVMTSDPREEESYMVVRLSIDDVDSKVVTARWHETTSKNGDYEGAMYSGAGQLILDDDKRHMEGLWAGAGYDHKLGKLRIYSGRWQLDRTD